MALTTIDTYGIKDGAVQIDDIGTLAGNLTINDSGKLRLGTGLDLQLWHDGSHSYIDNDTGWLYVGSDNHIFQNKEFNETHARFLHDGAVELYHNNVKTFTTESDGVAVIGPEGGNAFITFKADEGDDNADLFDVGVYDGGPFYISNKASGSWETNIECNGNGNVELYYDGNKKFETTSAGVEIDGKLTFAGDGHTKGIELGADADILLYHDNSNAYFDNNVGDFYIRNDGNSTSEKIRIQAKGGEQSIIATPNGNVELYYDNSLKLSTYSSGVSLEEHLWLKDSKELRVGDGSDLKIYHNGTNSYINNATGALAITGNDLNFENAARNETYAEMDNGGAVKLYYDNSKKFETLSDGARIHGAVYAETAGTYFKSNQLIFKPSGDAYIDHNVTGQDIYFRTSNSSALDTTAMIIRSNGSVTYPDNIKSKWGTGNDLQIFHDAGVHSYIDEIGNGNLVLRTNNSGTWSAIVLQAGSENSVIAYKNGGVELYYDAGKKFETLSSGAKVTGDFHITNSMHILDSEHLRIGSSNDLDIYHDGSKNVIKSANGHDTYFYANGTPETAIKYVSSGSVELYYDNVKKLETISTGASITGSLGIGTSSPGRQLVVNDNSANTFIRIQSSDTGNAGLEFGDQSDSVQAAIYQNASDNSLRFNGYNNAERLRIASDGNIGVGGTAPNYQFHCTSGIGIGGHGLSNQQLSLTNNAIQSLNLGVGYTALLLNKDGGNVGIGTSSPGHKLDVVGGNIRVGKTSNGQFIAENSSGAVKIKLDSSGVSYLIGGQVNIGASSPTASENGQFNCYTTTSSGKAQFVHDAGTGGLRLAGTGSGSGANLVFSNNYNSGTFSDHWTFSHNGGDDTFRVLSGGTGGTERLRIGTYGEIGVAGAGSINFGSAGQVLTSGGNSAGCQWKAGAKILQVVHTQSTTQSSLGQNTWHEVLEASITPSSTSSKILIQGMITFSENAGDVHVRIYLDNDGAHIGSGSASGSGTSSHSSGSCGRNAWDCTTNPVSYLHSPNSTSSRTYSIRAMCSNGSFKLNRQINGNQNHANDNAHSTNLVLMEVAA